MEEGWSAFKIVTGKPTGKRPLRRPWPRWEDNIRMGLKEIGISTRNWVGLAQDRSCRRAVLNVALNSKFHRDDRTKQKVRGITDL